MIMARRHRPGTGSAIYAPPVRDANPAGGLARRLAFVALGLVLWAWTASSLEAQAGRPAPRPAAPDSVAEDSLPVAAARVLLASPEGDTLGMVAPGAPLEVVGREGEWARVRVEGWIQVPPGTELRGPGPLRGLTLRALRAEPDRYRGQPVRWQIQFVALQRADSLRTDLRPGEEYMLARDPGGEPGFLYVVVPPHLLAAVRQLAPLQRLEVVGRVRTGRSPLMGHPILDLEALHP